MTQRPERSAARSIGLVGLVNIGIAIVGVLQAFVIGGIFGTSSSIEIYFAAVVFYQSIVNLMQTGQIAEVFTPIYHRLRESHGERTAFTFLSVLTNWMLVFAFALTVIVYLAADYLVPLTVPGFEGSRMATCISMFRWIVPLLAVQILQALLSTLLAAEKRFVFQEVIRLVCLIAGLLVVVLFHSHYGDWVMVGSLWVTNLAALSLYMVILFRIGYRHSFRFSHSDFSVSTVFKSTPSIFGYVLTTQLYSIALTAGLSMLPQGSLAVFSYARRIATRINGVLLRPISIVFFNHYSSALAAGEKAVSNLASRSLGITLFAASFAAVAVLSSGYPGLRAIWLSDRFPETAVLQTYLILSVLCIVPFFSGLGVIFRKINMSYQLVQRQYFYLAIVQVLSALLAYCLIPIWGLRGAVFVALANTVLTTLASGVLLKTKAKSAFCTYRPIAVAKFALVIAVAAVPALFLQDYLYMSEQHVAGGRLGDFAMATVLLLFSTLIATSAGLLLRVDEVQSVVRFGLNAAWRTRAGQVEKLPQEL